MDYAEQLVSLSYQSLGYFRPAQSYTWPYEVDLLALKPSEDGIGILERLHVEVSVSTVPVRHLGHSSNLGSVEEDVEEWARKKYIGNLKQRQIEQIVKRRFGTPDCQKVFVYGKLEEETESRQLDTLRGLQIECRTLTELVRRIGDKQRTREFKRLLEVGALLGGVVKPEDVQ